jgi:hypothetical protein
VTVTHVVTNSAAERASDYHGNTCPLRENDEIIEINGVSLVVCLSYTLENKYQLFFLFFC